MSERLLSGMAEDQPTPMNALVEKRVLMLLFEGYEDAEAACLLDILGWTKYRPSIATVNTRVAGLHDVVHGAFGTRIVVDLRISEVDPSRFDALVIPGGFHNFGYDEAYDEAVYKVIRAFRSRALPIATFCVGVLPVAQAGALDGGLATTYALSSRHDNKGVLRECGCKVASEAVVEWGGIISCSGPAYAERVCEVLLEKLVGPDAVAEVKRYRNGCA